MVTLLVILIIKNTTVTTNYNNNNTLLFLFILPLFKVLWVFTQMTGTALKRSIFALQNVDTRLFLLGHSSCVRVRACVCMFIKHGQYSAVVLPCKR